MKPKKIGELIRMKRKALRLTQEDLGKAVGRDRTLINDIENGGSKAGKDTYNLIAKYLELEFCLCFPLDDENNSTL